MIRHSDESKLHEKKVDFGLELQRGGGVAGIWVDITAGRWDSRSVGGHHGREAGQQECGWV